jgi:hypothetical protein
MPMLRLFQFSCPGPSGHPGHLQQHSTAQTLVIKLPSPGRISSD